MQRMWPDGRVRMSFQTGVEQPRYGSGGARRLAQEASRKVRGEQRKHSALFTQSSSSGASMEHILGVADWGSFATTANSAFLLAFSSLFSIINPIGGALIFYGFTKDFSSLDRVKVAARVGFYSLLIMFGALWTGTYILSFFGVSIDALRIGGGTVIALSGFRLLTTSDSHPDQKRHEREAAPSSDDDPMQLAPWPPPSAPRSQRTGLDSRRSSSARASRRSPTPRSSGSAIASPIALPG